MRASLGPCGEGSSGYRRLPMKCGEQTGLPLVPCPRCGEEVLELVAGAGSKVLGAVFFKCRLHERDVPGTCPWYLFADKYKQMLIARGLIGGTRVGGTEEQVPVNHDELRGLQGEEHDVEALKNGIAGLDVKLKKLVDLGQIGVVCFVIVSVFVVVGVISMLLE